MSGLFLKIYSAYKQKSFKITVIFTSPTSKYMENNKDIVDNIPLNETAELQDGPKM